MNKVFKIKTLIISLVVLGLIFPLFIKAQQNVPVKIQKIANQFLKGSKQKIFIGKDAFKAGTDFEKSLETYIGNLFTKLQNREFQREAAYDLAKIQKAREDVNKLMASVYGELTTQPIQLNPSAVLPQNGNDFFVNSRGIKIVGPSLSSVSSRGQANEENLKKFQNMCSYPNSVVVDLNTSNNNTPRSERSCALVKKSSRVIRNPDDYLFEEPRRKAYDFTMCYLAPWKHFPLTTITNRTTCKELDIPYSKCTAQKVCSKKGLTLPTSVPKYDSNNPNLCTVKNLCNEMMLDGQQCGNDVLRDKIKIRAIDKIKRKKSTVRFKFPPVEWYTPYRCNFFIQNSFPMARSLDKPEFGLALADVPEWNAEELLTSATDRESTREGLSNKVNSMIETIISDYEKTRRAQYIAGQGIKPSTYIVGFPVPKTGKKPRPEDTGSPNANTFWGSVSNYVSSDIPSNIFNTPVRGPTNQSEANEVVASGRNYYYFNTGNVISPAKILLAKLEGATQAQFDLARQAFKLPTGGQQGFATSTFSASNGEDTEITNFKGVKPDISSKKKYNTEQNELVAPWEDSNVNLEPNAEYDEGSGEYKITGSQQSEVYKAENIEGNFSNTVFNNVFQAYTWSFGDVLESWFKDCETTRSNPSKITECAPSQDGIFLSPDDTTGMPGQYP